MDFFAQRTIELNSLGLLVLDFVLYPFITILLCLLSVFVVLGNLLVVSAIWHENQLHSVTNYLIASLAAADCLVGAVVMPSSIISEIIIGSWTFGPTWCDLWHSFDVLASTASIMNLCAISLDRYLAITNPISYPTKMTPKRVAILIVSLWTCSSLISFPAIAWWRAVGDGPLQKFVNHPVVESTTASATRKTFTEAQSNNSSSEYKSFNENSSPSPPVEAPPNGVYEDEQVLYRCVFTDDTYYLLFSSIVSFYGPLCVMLYAYYRIYKAAVQQTRFLKYGSKQVMIGNSKRNKRLRNLITGDQNHHGSHEKYGLPETTLDGLSTTDNYDTHLVLRAHRGGGGGCNSTTSGPKLTHAESNSSASRAEQKGVRRDNQSTTNSESMVRISFDDEAMQQEASVHSEHTTLVDQKKQDNYRRNFDSSSQAASSAVDRRGRIDSMTNSKRDIKIRIGSQRFDSINEIAQENECSSNAVSGAIKGSTDEKSYEGIEDLVSSKRAVDNANKCVNLATMTHQNHGKVKTDQINPTIGKSLLATIKKKSNNVDVSIVEESPSSVNYSVPLSRQTKHGFFYTRPSEILRSKSRNEEQSYQQNKRGKGIERRVSNENVEHDDLHIGEDEEGDDEDDDSLSITSSGSTGSRGSRSESSSSSSSDSYGTGSIVSVLVKPRLANHSGQTDSQMPAKQSCDTIDKHVISRKMRRALSVGDADRHTNASKSDEDIESGATELMNEKNRSKIDLEAGPDWPRKFSSTVTMSIKNNKHRASSSNSIGTIAMVQEFRKNSKAFDIRFWVRKSRKRSYKDNEDNSSGTNDHMKPPPSLVPLMMMNSDTSTDSSVMANETKRHKGPTTMDRTGAKSSVIANAGVQQDISRRQNGSTKGQLEMSSARDDVAGCPVVSLATTLRQKSVPDLNSKKHGKHLARNLSFKDDNEQQNKVQMLYYDSDKLIQSIVNLTDIHYIDCTNRGAQSIAKTKDNYVAQTTSICKAEKSSFSTIDQSQVSQSQDDDRVSAATVARQRSTGKKLTKLAKERKAAKTLGIVVGVFILCWLPFFVVNIVVALCGTNCIYKPQILLAIVTWLGWLNSAMNPVIYACWSRDFRRAFRRVLCTWVECLYPYDNGKLARKLRLKKRSSNYSSAHETQLQRTASRSKITSAANNIGASSPGDRNGLSQAR